LHRSAPLVPVLALTLKLIETVQANVAADSEGCAARGEEGLSLARESGVAIFDFRLMAQMAQCFLTCGDPQLAGKYIKSMESSPAARLGWNKAALAYLKAFEALCSGKNAKALLHAGEAVDFARAAGSFKQIQNSLLLRAEALIENGKFDEAREIAEGVASESVLGGVPFITFAARLTLALLHYRKKAREPMRVELRKALLLGRRHGFVNTPLWRASVMSALLREAMVLGIESEYAAGCVEFRGLSSSSPPEEVEDWPWAVRLRAFGPLKIELHRKPVIFHGKVQKKPIQLLKLLVAVAPGHISDETAISSLWPDSDSCAGRQALNVTVHRLRALLEEKDALLHEEGWLSLSPKLVWIDAAAFRKHLKKAVEFAGSGEMQIA
ncbi:hypothetical protein FDZ71_13535, partial [bacterium]